MRSNCGRSRRRFGRTRENPGYASLVSVTMAAMSDLSSTRRTCILVDLENYSAFDGRQQHAAQAALAEVLTSAADAAGLDRLSWERQVSGDGELAVLPDGQSQVQVVGGFPI